MVSAQRESCAHFPASLLIFNWPNSQSSSWLFAMAPRLVSTLRDARVAPPAPNELDTRAPLQGPSSTLDSERQELKSSFIQGKLGVHVASCSGFEDICKGQRQAARCSIGYLLVPMLNCWVISRCSPQSLTNTGWPPFRPWRRLEALPLAGA